MKVAMFSLDTSHPQLLGLDLDEQLAKRRGKRSRVDHHPSVRPSPDSGSVRVPDEDEVSVGAVPLEKGSAASGHLVPRFEDSPDSARGKPRVAEKPVQVGRPVSAGLLALGNGGGRSTVGLQEGVQLVVGGEGFAARARYQFPCERSVGPPRDHLVEDDIAVGDEHGPVREVEMVVGRDLGIVVAGDKLHPRAALLGETCELGRPFCGHRGGQSRPSVGGVAVADQLGRTFE